MNFKELQKQYGQFINPDLPEPYYKFSLISLNTLVGGKGLRGGRIVQLVGAKSCGKSTISLDLIANAQKDGKPCALIDFERAFDPEYAEYLGVDVNGVFEDGITPKFTLIKPDTAETGLEICEALIESGTMLVVIDSVAAAVSKSEADKTLNDNERMMGTAGLIGRFLKRILPKVNDRGAMLIVINQIRANVSSMPNAKATKPFGGFPLQHNNSMTIEFTRIKNGEDESIVQCFTEKNRQGGKERRKCEITMRYGEGFDIAQDVILNALNAGIIDKKGAWLYTTVDGVEYKAQGMEKAREILPIERLRELLCNP